MIEILLNVELEWIWKEEFECYLEVLSRYSFAGPEETKLILQRRSEPDTPVHKSERLLT
jgi:hypothetical protein